MRDIVAEFHKTAGGRFKLFSISVIKGKGCDHYDVDLSRTYGYMFHLSGFGPAEHLQVSGIYWTSRDLEVKEAHCTLVSQADRKRNRTRRLRKVPKAFDLEPCEDLLEWLGQNAIEDSAVWCSTCRDWLPSESLCEHCWWCDKIGWYSTPDERCECGKRASCESA